MEEILGVPPERVVDVMALRGDSIDNIPGAPGIGDKGSVELIKRFGTVEQALDRAAEVEKKTYRESLQNNRDIILFSKRMATIDCNVPVDLDLDAMRAGEPDVEALRALFTELEFTSLLKELLPVVEVTEAHYTEAKSAADVEAVLKASLRRQSRWPWPSRPNPQRRRRGRRRRSRTSRRSSMLPLTGSALAEAAPRREASSLSPRAAGTRHRCRLQLGDAGSRLTLRSGRRRAFPRRSTITRPRFTRWTPQGITLRGVRHDPMLYSYLLDPTYSSHRLPEVALRRFNLKLCGTSGGIRRRHRTPCRRACAAKSKARAC